MKWTKEFREFAMRGNAVDLAVGVVFGAAFGKIATSLVNDILMPPLGMLLGRMDFRNLALTIGREANGEPVAVRYGAFLSSVLDFVIVAFALFVVIKAVNALRRRFEASVSGAPGADVRLLTEIRDLLKPR